MNEPREPLSDADQARVTGAIEAVRPMFAKSASADSMRAWPVFINGESWVSSGNSIHKVWNTINVDKENTPKKRGPKPGPPKSRVTLYLFDTTIEKLTTKAEAKGDQLPSYLAKRIESSVGRS